MADCSNGRKVMTEQQPETDVEDILEKCKKLSPDEKAELLKGLLGDSNLSVVFGNYQLHGDTIYQINLAEKEHMAEILRAIANRIENR